MFHKSIIQGTKNNCVVLHVVEKPVQRDYRDFSVLIEGCVARWKRMSGKQDEQWQKYEMC